MAIGIVQQEMHICCWAVSTEFLKPYELRDLVSQAVAFQDHHFSFIYIAVHKT